MRLVRVALAALLAGSSVSAARASSIVVEVRFLPDRALLGTPVFSRITLTNNSTETVLVPEDKHGLVLAMHWETDLEHGLVIPRPRHDGRRSMTPLAARERREYLLSFSTYAQSLPKACHFGTYDLSLVIDTRAQLSAADGWESRSAPTRLEVVEPAGEDARAYAHLLEGLRRYPALDLTDCAAKHVATRIQGSGGDLLQSFPSSSYAAYVVRANGLEWFAKGPSRTLYSLEHGSDSIGPIAVPCEEPCEEPAGLKSISGGDAVAWRHKWFAQALTSHPELWFADELRFDLACDRLASGDVAAGITALRSLAAGARPDVASQATELISLLEKRGWVR